MTARRPLAPNADRRFAWTAALASVAVAVAAAQAPPQAAARPPADLQQPDIERQDLPLQRRPYRIGLLLTFENQGSFTPQFRRRLVHDTDVLLHRTVGEPWLCEVLEAEARLRRFLEPGPLRPDDGSLAAYITDRDKLFVVHVGRRDARYRLTAREYDVTIQQWGPLQHRSPAVRGLLDRELVELCLAIFSPSAEQVPGSQPGKILLAVQGAALPTADPSVQLVRPDDVFGLVRLFRKDQTVQVQPVDWTYLTVEQVNLGTVQCSLRSAYRNPVTRRAPGSRLVAVGMRPMSAPTHLRFLGRDGHPLTGYEVHVADARGGAEAQLLSTDFQGVVTLPPADRLLSVSLRSGSQTLARLWVLPGSIADQKEIVIPDDPVRFQVESRLTALQDAIIDEVALRTLAVRRVHALMDRDQWQRARELLNRLNSSREPFQNRLDQIRADALRLAQERGSDSVHPKVREMIDQTQRYIDVLLVSKPVDDLRAEYRSRLQAAQAGSAR